MAHMNPRTQHHPPPASHPHLTGSTASPGPVPSLLSERAATANVDAAVRQRLPQPLQSAHVATVGYAEELHSQLTPARAELETLRLACRQAEAEAAAARAALQRLTHDLRTPLAAIAAWCSVLQRRKPETLLLRDALSGIARSAERQARLLDRAVCTEKAAPLPKIPIEALSYSEDSQPQASSSKANRLDDMKVLLVDDNADLRAAVSLALQASGAVVFPARDAAEALTLLRVERPRVLVCDIEMPVVDGHQLLARIRALSAESGGRIPALALTGLGVPAHADRASFRFDAYVQKGFGHEALLRAIQAVAAADDQKSK